MRRTAFAILTAAFLLVLTSFSAVAAGQHFTHGGEPICDVALSGASATVSCSGELAGLGNEDLLIDTTVSGSALYQCQNPGGNLAPGQNRVLEGPVTEPTLIPSDAIKNGRVAFDTNDVTLTAPETVSAAVAGCPSSGWTGVNPTLTVTDIVLDISQGGVLLFHCTASDPDGLSGTVALAC
jgi:hypothetical protein